MTKSGLNFNRETYSKGKINLSVHLKKKYKINILKLFKLKKIVLNNKWVLQIKRPIWIMFL